MTLPAKGGWEADRVASREAACARTGMPLSSQSAFTVKIVQLSGNQHELSVYPDWSLDQLTRYAAESFGVCYCLLLTADCRELSGHTTIASSGLKPGDVLTLSVLGPVAIVSNKYAIAVFRKEGSVCIWGDPNYGGTGPECGLDNVAEIHATESAFAALKADGSVVTWGSPDDGGDSSAVQTQLRDVTHVYSTCGSFAALRCDGSVVTWGNQLYGGLSRVVQGQLESVNHIYATDCAFAALLKDGTLVTWGKADSGGDCSQV